MELTYLMDSVRQDHALLCGELDVLKNAEGDDSPPSWQTLRDACKRLSMGLREHMLREERLLATRGRSLGAAASEALAHPSSDHYNDYRYLQVITRYVTSENRPFLLNNRYHLLTDFLRGLRCHMNTQESELSTALEPATVYVVA
jgi:hypothetical protein